MLRGSPPCRGREAWRVFRDRIPRARPKETACAGKSEKRREGRVRRDGASGGRDAALGSRGDARGASVRARRAGRGRACGCGDVAAGGRRHRGPRADSRDATEWRSEWAAQPSDDQSQGEARGLPDRTARETGLSTQKEIPTLGRVEPRTTVQRDRAGRARSGKIGSSNEQRSNAGRVKILPNTSWAECTTKLLKLLFSQLGPRQIFATTVDSSLRSDNATVVRTPTVTRAGPRWTSATSAKFAITNG